MSISSSDSESVKYKSNIANKGQLQIFCRIRPPLTGEYEKNKKIFSHYI